MARTAAAKERGNTAMAFAIVNKSAVQTGYRSICTHCQKQEHEIIACFQLLGYRGKKEATQQQLPAATEEEQARAQVGKGKNFQHLSGGLRRFFGIWQLGKRSP